MKPDYSVSLDGTKLKPEEAGAILGIRVYQTRFGASAFELVISDPEQKWQGKPTFTECKECKIELGVPGKLKTVFDGEVTAWRTELERNGPSVLVVRGLDRSHRLMRGQKTKTYKDATPLDVAKQIAGQHGLTAKTRAGTVKPVKTFRFQANQSDFEFLRAIADLEGYMFWVEAKELHFERVEISQTDDAEFEFGHNLETFLPVANFRKPAQTVQVGGWDPAGKGEVEGTAKKGQQLWTLPGGKQGADVSKFSSTKTELSLVESQVSSKEHADTVAKAALTKRAMEFITAECEVQGDPRVKPGAMVNLKKVGAYSGHYLVTEANHFYDAAGYHCIFYVARDKWGNTSTAAQQAQAAKKQPAAKAQQQKAAKQVLPEDFVLQILDEESGEPVPQVTLEVTLAKGAKRVLRTDGDGFIHVADAGKGQNQVACSIAGAKLETTLAFVGKGAPAGGGPADTSLPPLPAPPIVATITEHKVKTGETLAKLASNTGLTLEALATFNWGVSTPPEINEKLRTKVGCTKKTSDGKNYVFDDADDPGIVYVPKAFSESGLASGQPHSLRVRRIKGRLPDLRMLYQIDPHAPAAKDDLIVLETVDGSWRHEIKVKTLSEVEPHWVELVFPKPPAGARFNLLQDPGDGQPPMMVYREATYAELGQEGQA